MVSASRIVDPATAPTRIAEHGLDPQPAVP
jgi:hypothetical protein